MKITTLIATCNLIQDWKKIRLKGEDIYWHTSKKDHHEKWKGTSPTAPMRSQMKMVSRHAKQWKQP